MIFAETAHLTTFQYGAKMWQLQKPLTHSKRIGQSRSQQKGRGIEFHNARIYQPGDDVRSIDWRITARKSKTHAREFQEDREHQIMLVADMSQSMKFGSKNKLKSVTAAEIAALLGWITLAQQDRVGGWIHADKKNIHKPARRRANFSAWLGQLSNASKALIAQKKTQPYTWENTLENLFRFLKESSMVIFIGDMLSLNEFNRKTIISQSKQHDITLIHVYDELEINLPKSGYANFSNGDITLRTSLNKIHSKVQSAYEREFHQLRDQCLASNVSFLSVSNEDSLVPSMQQQGLIRKI